jgi:cardiolipin synthase A/B
MTHSFLNFASSISCGNKADFYLEGQSYYDFYVDLIDRAETTVHLQTYIFEMDRFGSRVHQTLIQAARRGVHVYMLIDSVGSAHFSDINEKELKDAGVKFYRFNALAYKWFYQWGRRLHHKVLLIDHEKALVGGINVTTSGYGHNNLPQQLDFAVYLEGPVIPDLCRYCQFVFQKAGAGAVPMEPVYGNCQSLDKSSEHIDLKISINDWVYRRWQITKRYADITKYAQHDITIINSYFFPRRKFMNQLAAAARRGVRVRLILPMISDWPSHILASRYLYLFFLKSGIEIYEWNKSILHGKLATVDGQFATIGSFNLNYTSYQQNLEMNVDIMSTPFTQNLNNVIDEVIRVGCHKIEPNSFMSKSTLRHRFLRFFFYVILSIVANFSVSLIYREEKGANKYLSLARIVCGVLFLILGIIATIIPVTTGTPFLIISFLLVYRQLLFNKKLSI